MFGLFGKNPAKSARELETDKFISSMKSSTQRSWAVYRQFYNSLNPSDRTVLAEKIQVAFTMVEREVSIEKMQNEPLASVSKLNKLQVVFTSLGSTDRLLALAGQMFITYLFAQIFWDPNERKEIADVIREASEFR